MGILLRDPQSRRCSMRYRLPAKVAIEKNSISRLPCCDHDRSLGDQRFEARNTRRVCTGRTRHRLEVVPSMINREDGAEAICLSAHKASCHAAVGSLILAATLRRSASAALSRRNGRDRGQTSPRTCSSVFASESSLSP